MSRRVHHAYPLATRTDCGRRFVGRLERKGTIVARTGSGNEIDVTNNASAVTCRWCLVAQP